MQCKTSRPRPSYEGESRIRNGDNHHRRPGRIEPVASGGFRSDPHAPSPVFPDARLQLELLHVLGRNQPGRRLTHRDLVFLSLAIAPFCEPETLVFGSFRFQGP